MQRSRSDPTGRAPRKLPQVQLLRTARQRIEAGKIFRLAEAGPVLLLRVEKFFRLRFVAGLFAAAVLAAIFAVPFLSDQIATVASRGTGAPIVIHHVEVLGE